MSEQKSIYAAYEEIKRREVKELEDAVRKAGGEYVFKKTRPVVMCNLNGFEPHPADVVITSVELRDEEDEDVLYIFGYEEDVSGCASWECNEVEVKISDIAYGHIEFITSAIVSPKPFGRREDLLHETIAQLSADIYKDVYEHCESYTDTCETIVSLAKRFEKELNWQDNDERDYILELEKFERKYLDSIEGY